MNQSADDAPRLETPQGRHARPSADAVELAWILRGSQTDAGLGQIEGDAGERLSDAEPNVFVEEARVPVAHPAMSAATAFEVDGDERPVRKRDWSSALDLVQEACEAIRISEERVLDLERQNQQSSFQSREDIKALQLQLQASERRVQAAEARATAAESRAMEAESWLARLHDAITMGFGSSAKSTEL